MSSSPSKVISKTLLFAAAVALGVAPDIHPRANASAPYRLITEDTTIRTVDALNDIAIQYNTSADVNGGKPVHLTIDIPAQDATFTLTTRWLTAASRQFILPFRDDDEYISPDSIGTITIAGVTDIEYQGWKEDLNSNFYNQLFNGTDRDTATIMTDVLSMGANTIGYTGTTPAYPAFSGTIEIKDSAHLRVSGYLNQWVWAAGANYPNDGVIVGVQRVVLSDAARIDFQNTEPNIPDAAPSDANSMAVPSSTLRFNIIKNLESTSSTTELRTGPDDTYRIVVHIDETYTGDVIVGQTGVFKEGSIGKITGRGWLVKTGQGTFKIKGEGDFEGVVILDGGVTKLSSADQKALFLADTVTLANAASTQGGFQGIDPTDAALRTFNLPPLVWLAEVSPAGREADLKITGSVDTNAAYGVLNYTGYDSVLVVESTQIIRNFQEFHNFAGGEDELFGSIGTGSGTAVYLTSRDANGTGSQDHRLIVEQGVGHDGWYTGSFISGKSGIFQIGIVNSANSGGGLFLTANNDPENFLGIIDIQNGHVGANVQALGYGTVNLGVQGSLTIVQNNSGTMHFVLTSDLGAITSTFLVTTSDGGVNRFGAFSIGDDARVGFLQIPVSQPNFYGDVVVANGITIAFAARDTDSYAPNDAFPNAHSISLLQGSSRETSLTFCDTDQFFTNLKMDTLTSIDLGRGTITARQKDKDYSTLLGTITGVGNVIFLLGDPGTPGHDMTLSLGEMNTYFGATVVKPGAPDNIDKETGALLKSATATLYLGQTTDYPAIVAETDVPFTPGESWIGTAKNSSALILYKNTTVVSTILDEAGTPVTVVSPTGLVTYAQSLNQQFGALFGESGSKIIMGTSNLTIGTDTEQLINLQKELANQTNRVPTASAAYFFNTIRSGVVQDLPATPDLWDFTKGTSIYFLTEDLVKMAGQTSGTGTALEGARSLSFAGSIVSSGDLIKIGDQRLTFSGVTYSPANHLPTTPLFTEKGTPVGYDALGNITQLNSNQAFQNPQFTGKIIVKDGVLRTRPDAFPYAEAYVVSSYHGSVLTTYLNPDTGIKDWLTIDADFLYPNIDRNGEKEYIINRVDADGIYEYIRDSSGRYVKNELFNEVSAAIPYPPTNSDYIVNPLYNGVAVNTSGKHAVLEFRVGPSIAEADDIQNPVDLSTADSVIPLGGEFPADAEGNITTWGTPIYGDYGTSVVEVTPAETDPATGEIITPAVTKVVANPFPTSSAVLGDVDAKKGDYNGSGDIAKTGTGTMRIPFTINGQQPYTYTGTTFVREGKLIMPVYPCLGDIVLGQVLYSDVVELSYDGSGKYVLAGTSGTISFEVPASQGDVVHKGDITDLYYERNTSSQETDEQGNVLRTINALSADISNPAEFVARIDGLDDNTHAASGNVEKLGDGKLTLLGDLSTNPLHRLDYTGTTIVREGELVFSGLAVGIKYINDPTSVERQVIYGAGGEVLGEESIYSRQILVADPDFVRANIPSSKSNYQIWTGATLTLDIPENALTDTVAEIGGTISTAGDFADGGYPIFRKTGLGLLRITRQQESFEGDIDVQAGELSLTVQNALAKSHVLNIAKDAIVNFNNTRQTFTNLTGEYGAELLVGSGSITLRTTGDQVDDTFAYYGTISGTEAAQFIKDGPGSLKLRGSNEGDFKGEFVVENGILDATVNALGDRPVTINAKGTLRLYSENSGDLFADTYTQPINGIGNLEKTGVGTLHLTWTASNPVSALKSSVFVSDGKLIVDSARNNNLLPRTEIAAWAIDNRLDSSTFGEEIRIDSDFIATFTDAEEVDRLISYGTLDITKRATFQINLQADRIEYANLIHGHGNLIIDGQLAELGVKHTFVFDAVPDVRGNIILQNGAILDVSGIRELPGGIASDASSEITFGSQESVFYINQAEDGEFYGSFTGKATIYLQSIKDPITKEPAVLRYYGNDTNGNLGESDNPNTGYQGKFILDGGSLQVGVQNTKSLELRSRNDSGTIYDSSLYINVRDNEDTDTPYRGQLTGEGNIVKTGAGDYSTDKLLFLAYGTFNAKAIIVEQGELTIANYAHLANVETLRVLNDGYIVLNADPAENPATRNDETGVLERKSISLAPNILQGEIPIYKRDVETLLLADQPNYTGNFVVEKGTIGGTFTLGKVSYSTTTSPAAVANLTIKRGATLSPGSGNEVGTIQIAGNLTLDENSTLKIKLGKDAAGVAHNDVVYYGRDAFLNGSIEVYPDGTGLPARGDKFVFLKQINPSDVLNSTPTLGENFPDRIYTDNEDFAAAGISFVLVAPNFAAGTAYEDLGLEGAALLVTQKLSNVPGFTPHKGISGKGGMLEILYSEVTSIIPYDDFKEPTRPIENTAESRKKWLADVAKWQAAKAVYEVGAVLNMAAATELNKLVNQLSPLSFGSLVAMPSAAAANTVLQLHERFEQRRYDLTQYPMPQDQWPRKNLQFFFAGYGTTAEFSTGSDSPTFDYKVATGIVGADILLSPRALLGLAVDYAYGRSTFNDGGGNATMNAVRGTLNFSYLFNPWFYADFGFSAGSLDYETRRNTLSTSYSYINEAKNIVSGGSRHTNYASPDGWTAGGFVTIGTVIPLMKHEIWQKVNLNPYIGVEYNHHAINAFTETGAATALRVTGFEFDSLRTRIGTGLNWIADGNGRGISASSMDSNFKFNLDIAFVAEVMDTESKITARYNVLQSSNFKTDARSLPDELIQIAPSVTYSFDSATSVSAGYRFETSFDGALFHNVNISFRIRF